MAHTPTIKEIAERLQLSKSTVSRALRNHPGIGLKTRMLVQQLAKELHYEPNQTAIFFQQQKTFTIGIVLPELSEAFFSAAISGIEDTANQHSYMVLLGQSHDDTTREQQIVDTMKKHRVDGLIISLAKNTCNYSHFTALRNIPVVFFDRIPNMDHIHFVACDIEAGAFQAAHFLLEKGHRVVGMLNGPDNLLASGQRTAGHRRALEKQRLKYDASLNVITDLSKESTKKAMQQLLAHKRRPTAIIAFNDYVARDAVQYAVEQGHTSLTFVSYANLPASSYMAHPPIASVEQFPYLQGQKAMELLLHLLTGQHPDNIIIQPQLIIHQ